MKLLARKIANLKLSVGGNLKRHINNKYTFKIRLIQFLCTFEVHVQCLGSHLQITQSTASPGRHWAGPRLITHNCDNKDMKKYCNAYYQLYPCANTHVLSELNSSQLLSGDFSWKRVIELSSAKVQKILGMTRAGKISGFVSCFMCVIRMEPGCLLSLRHWTLTRVSGCYCFMSGT